MKAEIVKSVRLSNQLVEENHALMELAVELMEQSIAADRYDLALSFHLVASGIAKRFRASTVVRELTDRVKELRRSQDEFQAFEQSQATLAKDPDDPNANLVAGRFLCFGKQRWDEGLPLLAKSSDEGLANQARNELAVQQPKDTAAAADGWLELAEKTRPPQQHSMLRRASILYAKALPELAGLDKVKAEKRLEAIGPPELIGLPDFVRKDLVLMLDFNREPAGGDPRLVKDRSVSRNHARLASPPAANFLAGSIATLTVKPELGRGPFTVAVWAQTDSLAGAAATYGRGVMRSTTGESPGDWILSVLGDGKIRFAYWTAAGTQTDGAHVSTVPVFQPGSWCHLAASWDGAAAHLFVNGQEVPYTNLTTISGWGTAHEIGNIYNGESYRWNGKIDNLFLFKRALPAQEIVALSRLRPPAGN